MSGSWNADIKFIQDGERVDANVSGRPDRGLTDRTQYLKDRIDAMDNGQALFAFDVAVEADALIGQPVYWNGETQRFERAQAAVAYNVVGGLSNVPTSEVIGIVYSKLSPILATLLIGGKAAVDLEQSVTGLVTAGRYFLSSSEPGKLTQQIQGVSVPVLFADGAGIVYMNLQHKDLAEEHQHYTIGLYMTVAGNCASADGGGCYSIEDPDNTRTGWLPADDEIFNESAPAGAVFGYNLAAHPELSNLWPPVPLSAASLTLFEKCTGLGKQVSTGPGGIATIDASGIWWMSCEGEMPWDGEDCSSISSSAADCPHDKALVLYFLIIKYGPGYTVVTSLRADEGSPLLVTNLDGNPATTGDLKISFDSDFTIASNTATGSLVFKELSGNQFSRGRVTEGIRAANNSVLVTSTESRTDGTGVIHQGIVTIESNIEGLERIITPQVVRLIDVKERYEYEIMYLGLSSAIRSSVRYKFKLPNADAFPANPKLKLRLTLTGDVTTSSFPSLTVSYRRLPKATTGTAIPTTDTALSFTTGMALTGDYYIQKDSAELSVAESDVVLFTVTRNSSGDDGYLGEIGIIDAVAVLSPGA